MDSNKYNVYLDFRTFKNKLHRIGQVCYSLNEEDFARVAAILGKYTGRETNLQEFVEKDDGSLIRLV